MLAKLPTCRRIVPQLIGNVAQDRAAVHPVAKINPRIFAFAGWLNSGDGVNL
jgi:hypothetical protein